MILHSRRTSRYRKTILALTRPNFQAVDFETGEVFESSHVLFECIGGLVVFNDLSESLDDLVFELARHGSIELYGSEHTAAYWHYGGGVRFAGLNSYNHKCASLSDLVSFWKAITDICEAVHTVPCPTASETAIQIAQAMSPEMFVSPSRPIQEWCRNAYSAGAAHFRVGDYGDTFLYDIRSAYPFAMSQPLPFGRWCIGDSRMDFFVARVTFDYDSDLEFSPLWIRGADTKVYHPTQARNVTAILNSIDLETLRQHGSLNILESHDCIGFETIDLLSPSINYLSACQAQLPQYAQPIKKLKNSIYGKMCQRSDQERFILKYTADDDPDDLAEKGIYKEYNGYEYCLTNHQTESRSFSHIIVAGAITSLIRQKLYNAIDEDSIACQTDSILSTRRRLDLTRGVDPSQVGSWYLKEKTKSSRVYGRKGFIFGDTPHMSGVQRIKIDGRGRVKAYTSGKGKFDFGAATEGGSWAVKKESPYSTLASGPEIQLCKRGRVIETIPIPETKNYGD